MHFDFENYFPINAWTCKVGERRAGSIPDKAEPVKQLKTF